MAKRARIQPSRTTRSGGKFTPNPRRRRAIRRPFRSSTDRVVDARWSFSDLARRQTLAGQHPLSYEIAAYCQSKSQYLHSRLNTGRLPTWYLPAEA